ncbi:MAG: heavy-metal-associated domain-containing protein [Acidaminobacteraceae bacterium]
MKKATIQLEALACPSCVQKIENATKALSGIEKTSVEILFNSSRAKFDFDDEIIAIKDVENAITALGYKVIKSKVKDK